MQFTYGDVTYRLEFQRKHKNVEVVRDGRVKTIKSMYPYTTAKLLEVAPGKLSNVVASAAVGCLPIDTFNTNTGRIESLRALWKQLKRSGAQDDFGAALWEAYLNRGQRPEPIVVVTAPGPRLLPAHTEDSVGNASV